MMFEITIRRDDGNFDNDIGDANSFDSVADAEQGIEELRAIEDFATSDLRVRRIGDNYPLDMMT